MTTAPTPRDRAVEAEEQYLGGLLQCQDYGREKLIPLGLTSIESEHLQVERHRVIFDAMRKLHGDGLPIHWHLVSQYVNADTECKATGKDVLRLVDPYVSYTLTEVTLRHYSTLIRDRAVRKRLDVAVRTAAQDLNGQTDTLDAMAELGKCMSDIEADVPQDNLVDGQALLDEYLAEIRAERDGKLKGTPFGLPRIDHILGGGLNRGHLMLLGGTPGVGKTSLAAQHAIHGIKRGDRVVFFSLEMKRSDLVETFLQNEGRTTREELRQGKRTDSVARIAHELAQGTIAIDDRGSLTIAEIRSAAMQRKAAKGLDMIVVDYVQKVQDPGAQSEVERITNVSEGLRALAKSLEVSVLALTQLSRAPSNRTSKRPELTDLRGSGMLEADAHVVAFLYREGDDGGETEFLIRKNRQGPTGKVPLYFTGEHKRFDEMEDDKR